MVTNNCHSHHRFLSFTKFDIKTSTASSVPTISICTAINIINVKSRKSLDVTNIKRKLRPINIVNKRIGVMTECAFIYKIIPGYNDRVISLTSDVITISYSHIAMAGPGWNCGKVVSHPAGHLFFYR